MPWGKLPDPVWALAPPQALFALRISIFALSFFSVVDTAWKFVAAELENEASIHR